jgi:hypothetical protein
MERAKSIVKLGESKYVDKRDGSLMPDNDDDNQPITTISKGCDYYDDIANETLSS